MHNESRTINVNKKISSLTAYNTNYKFVLF